MKKKDATATKIRRLKGITHLTVKHSPILSLVRPDDNMRLYPKSKTRTKTVVVTIKKSFLKELVAFVNGINNVATDFSFNKRDYENPRHA